MIEPDFYNIPASLYGTCRARTVAVRSRDPAEIVKTLGAADLERVSYVQVLTLHADLQPLGAWAPGIPVDLTVEDPEEDLPLLYPCAPLLDRHPVRITVPVVPGFGKVVKLAASLNFAVKLEVLQPAGTLIEEMDRVLHAYLHKSMVSQPIEYFHSVFLALYRGEPLTLWTIQEEDPVHCRYVTESGEETLSARFAAAGIAGGLARLPERIAARFETGGSDCSQCEFLRNCSGYFKWPDAGYRCDGMKALFRTMAEAARQLKGDLEAYRSAGGEDRS